MKWSTSICPKYHLSNNHASKVSEVQKSIKQASLLELQFPDVPFIWSFLAHVKPIEIVEGRKGRKVVNFISLNPLTTSVPHHIETSQFIRRENQLTDFYMMGNIGR